MGATALHKLSPLHRARVFAGGPALVKACYRTPKSAQMCAICGVAERFMHLPTGRVGHFCGHCCPACANKEQPGEV